MPLGTAPNNTEQAGTQLFVKIEDFAYVETSRREGLRNPKPT